MLGFLTGAFIFGLTYPTVFPKISQLAKVGNTTFEVLWNINTWLFIILFGLISLLLFYLIDRAGLYRKDRMSEDGKPTGLES
ncbi:MAG: hypothetical protein A2Z14_15570 [Chloroflexi bacterium RBG_16_48_8]|nr:MAG: hypothetical protein A2Z14_15570 [Chloroflexi bacterium RBG_16_48_8]